MHTGTQWRPEDQAVSSLGLFSLPHCTSEAGVWVLLVRVGLPFLMQALLSPFDLCPVLPLPRPVDPFEVSFSH